VAGRREHHRIRSGRRSWRQIIHGARARSSRRDAWIRTGHADLADGQVAVCNAADGPRHASVGTIRNEARWPMDSDANAGATLTMTPLVIVTVAAAISGPLIGWGLTVA